MGETASPSFLLSNRIQFKNSRFRPTRFSTWIPIVSTPGFEYERTCGHSTIILTKSWHSWETRLLEIKFSEVSGCQISSRSSQSLNKSPNVSWFIFKISFFWWFLGHVGVFSCEESASHPLSLYKRECPKSLNSRCFELEWWICIGPYVVRSTLLRQASFRNQKVPQWRW